MRLGNVKALMSFFLAYPVQSRDSLLQQLGMKRHIKQNEWWANWKIPSFHLLLSSKAVIWSTIPFSANHAAFRSAVQSVRLREKRSRKLGNCSGHPLRAQHLFLRVQNQQDFSQDSNFPFSYQPLTLGSFSQTKNSLTSWFDLFPYHGKTHLLSRSP